MTDTKVDDSLRRLQKEWPTDENVPTPIILKKYDAWDEYDDDMNTLGYQGPTVLAAKVEEAGIPNNSLILDIGCGTGLVGIKLNERGYKNVHGHDGSAPLLKKAKQSGAYSNLICCYLGDGNTLPVETGFYDCVVMAGSASPGHFMLDAFPDMIRVIKPGGFFAHNCREENLRKAQHSTLMDYFKHLEESSVWEMVLEERFPTLYTSHSRLVPGIVQVYKVLKQI